MPHDSRTGANGRICASAQIASGIGSKRPPISHSKLVGGTAPLLAVVKQIPFSLDFAEP